MVIILKIQNKTGYGIGILGGGEAGNNSWNVRQDGQGTQVGTETFELEGRGGGLREVK